MDGFATRLSAMEGSYFRAEEKLALERYMEQLVAEGKISEESLDTLKRKATAASGIPTEVRGRPEGEFIYRHQKGALPTPNFPTIKGWSLGTPVSMGRGRWVADNVSIFDVSQAKKMAQTPRQQASLYELRRAKTIQKAAMDTPLVGGYRWLPELTPGRAFFWGTLLALAGTAIGSKVACKVLGIQGVDDISEKVEQSMAPLTRGATKFFGPIGAAMHTAGSESAAKSTAIGEFAEKIKQNLQSH